MSFRPVESWTYTLGPQQGFGSSAVFVPPDCPGHYKVKASVLFEGRTLDHVLAGFGV